MVELTRISDNIAVLRIDSERSSAGDPISADRQAFVNICKRLNIPCHVLERRATENYFTEGAVKSANGPTHKALGDFERLEDASPRWKKRENWRINL
jgi:hypothetical protein